MILGASQMLPGQTLSIPKTLGVSSVAHDMGHQNTLLPLLSPGSSFPSKVTNLS